MSTNQIVCKNCGSEQVAEFCSHCGQKTITKRYTTKGFLLKFLSAFNIEKGFFYTMKMLFIDPGKVINEYLGGRTKAYFNPLNYFIIIAGLSALIMVSLGIFEANVETTNEFFGFQDKQLKFQNTINDFIKQYINIISLLILPFSSLVSKLYYNRRKWFYGEHLIYVCFLNAQVSIISILLLILLSIFPHLNHYLLPFGFLIAIIYYSYALKKIFKSSTLKSILGAISINIGGQLIFTIVVTILTIVALIILVASGVNIKDVFQ